MRKDSARHALPHVRPGQSTRRRRPTPLGIEALEERTVPTLLGQSLFPADNPWNQNIANAPVAANSTAVINNIIANQGSDGRIHPDFGQDSRNGNSLYGIPYNVVHGNSTPKVHVVIDAYPGESDLQDAPIASGVVLEGDFQNGPRAGVNNRGDSHLIVWDEDNNVAYEFYRASRPSENSDGRWHADQETVWDMKTDTFRTLGWTSADAAGLSVLAGLVRPDEGLPTSQGGQGVINHAIRFTLRNALILDQFIYPASHEANPNNTNAAVMPPMGARFRLKANVDISGLNPEAKVVAQAMKDYGLILADNGSNFYFSGASYAVDANNQFTSTWSDNDIQDSVHGLKSLTFSDFEVVDLTPVVTGLSTQSGAAGTTVTVTGQNFSGAAGHLQVLFGNTPGTSVTVLDDAHVSAVVPAGTGTVDVRVQSGVTTASRSDNYKNPVFGYGTSATNAADKFTYSSSTSSATHFAVSAPAGATAGGSFTVTVTALDSNNATVAGYTGSVHFTSTDGLAVLPADYTFTTADNGSHAFSVTLKTAGSDGVTATDRATSSINGSASVSVSPAAAATLTVAAPASATAGSAFTVTVTAKDAFGNVATGYRGTVHFTSSDAQAVLPANYAFTATDNGSHSFSVTLKTAGSDGVTATDTVTGSVTGSRTVSVNAAGAASLALSASTTSVTAGSAFTATLKAKDAFGNAATGYTGKVHFTSSDPAAVLPADYTFTAADAGSHAFSVTLKTAGTQSVTATDTASPGLTATASGIQVTSSTGGTNVAPLGTAYRWWLLTSPTDTTNQAAAPALNDGNKSVSISLKGSATEQPNRYEAGGVIWSSAQTINRVVFKNGPYNQAGNGVFDANLSLQFTNDGTTWYTASGWVISPAYAYNSSAASNVTYTFNGPVTSVRGFRVVGQIFTATKSSHYVWMNEVQAFTPSATAAPAALTAGPTSGGDTALRSASILLSAPRSSGGVASTTGTVVGQGGAAVSRPVTTDGATSVVAAASAGKAYTTVLTVRPVGTSLSATVGLDLAQDLVAG